jgi:hypothetical protein
MHPTVVLSIVLLSWCLVRNRSKEARLLLGSVAALLGWEPAMGGNRSGTILLLVALGFAVSLVYDLVVERIDLARAQPRLAPAPAQAPSQVAATMPSPPPRAPRQRGAGAPRFRVREMKVNRAQPMPGVTHSTPPPPVPPPPGQWAEQAAVPPSPPRPAGWSQAQQRRLAGEPLTDLERAEAYGDLLEANLEGLVDAYRSGDVRAQAAFAGEIAGVAQSMESALRVVVGERYRMQGQGETRPPTGSP